VSASVASRVLPVRIWTCCTLLYSLFRDTDVPQTALHSTGQPCTCSCWRCTRLWPCSLCSSLHLRRVPSPHELPTVLPSPFKTGRRQRDYCAIRTASGDDSRGLSTQVPRRISSQLKGDCADPRERSRSIIAASQNLRPMTWRRGLWGLRSRSKIDRQSSPSASSASCGRRLNKVVCPRSSWMLEWLKWFVDTKPN